MGRGLEFRCIPLLSLLVAGCASPSQVSIAIACEEGQSAREGFLADPESLLGLWEVLREGHVAVLASRRSERTHADPLLNPSAPGEEEQPRFVECNEVAFHDVVDGLGWVEDDSIRVLTRTGQGYWARGDGSPVSVPGDRVVSEHFFEPETMSLAGDDQVYLLLLAPHPDGFYRLVRRSPLVDDTTVSGYRTVSGDTVAVDSFRAGR